MRLAVVRPGQGVRALPHLDVRVCAFVRACVCVRAHMRVCGRACVLVGARLCVVLSLFMPCVCECVMECGTHAQDIVGWGENDRGVSFTFGPDVVASFLKRHDLDLICRAHQVGTAARDVCMRERRESFCVRVFLR